MFYRQKWPKVCKCGEYYTEYNYMELPTVGVQILRDRSFDLRACKCGSTLAVEIVKEDRGSENLAIGMVILIIFIGVMFLLNGCEAAQPNLDACRLPASEVSKQIDGAVAMGCVRGRTGEGKDGVMCLYSAQGCAVGAISTDCKNWNIIIECPTEPKSDYF